MVSRTRRAVLRATALAGALALSLAACSSSDDSGSSDGGSKAPNTSATADMQAALDKGGDLKVWAWEPTLKKVVTGFEAKYPNVHVDLQNVGTGNDQYTALQNAISAGSGIPDVAQVEYYALPQFAIGGSLADLTGMGASDLASTYTPGPWASVQQGGKIYGLPMDSGPMAMFYNKKIFDKYKIDVPTTWEQYVAAAKKLHAADPKEYITSDNGDAGFTTSMIWQAGGQPYKVDGTNVTIDFGDAGAQKFTTMWQPLIDQKLLSPVNGWTDEWFQGLANGTIATLVTGAWMPANLESGAAAASGDWRVAPMPQWSDGDSVTAENGGSALSVMQASDKKELAYAFLNYANAGDGVQTRVDGGAFPATTAALEADSFQNAAPKYFGGQKINKVLAESAQDVAKGWQYLPFQVYSNSIYKDTVGKAYTSSGTTLQDGLSAWQDASAKYGNQQGFTVNK